MVSIVALVGAFSVIVQPVVEPMEHYTALVLRLFILMRSWVGATLAVLAPDTE